MARGSNITFNLVANDKASSTVNKFGSTLDKQQQKLEKVKNVAGGIVLAGAAAGAVLVKSASDAASDLQETVNKSNVVFGQQADEMLRWGESAVTSVGMSQQAALAAASTFGDMFSQLGFGGQEAANMSQEVVKLGADLGSFHNLETADVLDRISAATRGEYDSLQALIPNINAARVEQEALAMTGKDTADALTQAEKVSATLAVIQRDGANAANDFSNTIGSQANQEKVLAAQTEDLQAKIGTKLLPVITKLTGVALGLVTALTENEALLYSVGGVIAGVMVGAAISWTAAMIGTNVQLAKQIWGLGAATVAKAKDLAAGAALRTMYAVDLVKALAAKGAAMAVSTARTVAGTAAMLAQRAAMVAVRGAMLVATAAQWAWNAALTANPIGIVLIAVAALVAGVVWAWNNVDWFREGLISAWEWIKGVWEKAPEFFSGLWGKVTGFFSGAKDWIVTNFLKWTPLGMVISNWGKITAYFGIVKSKVTGFMSSAKDRLLAIWKWTPIGMITSNWGKITDFFKDIPSKIRTAFSTLKSKITSPFKSAFNAVAGFWNRTVGSLSFTTPDWVPGIGGKGFSMPTIPLLAKGGILTGPTLFMGGEGGETEVVQPLSKLDQFMRNYVPRDENYGDGGDTYLDLSGITLEVRDEGGLVTKMRTVAGQVVKADRRAATAGRRAR